MSKNFERWKELAGRCLGEQDPAKLAELAGEMNILLTQKTPAAGSHEDSKRDVLKSTTEGKVCFAQSGMS